MNNVAKSPPAVSNAAGGFYVDVGFICLQMDISQGPKSVVALDEQGRMGAFQIKACP